MSAIFMFNPADDSRRIILSDHRGEPGVDEDNAFALLVRDGHDVVEVNLPADVVYQLADNIAVSR